MVIKRHKVLPATACLFNYEMILNQSCLNTYPDENYKQTENQKDMTVKGQSAKSTTNKSKGE